MYNVSFFLYQSIVIIVRVFIALSHNNRLVRGFLRIKKLHLKQQKRKSREPFESNNLNE